ncbi:hypothetical protein [Rubinisphaera sp. JC750]|uniref:hypothetical protein n=1 Tax=Rubinisphaera sp. JC750 TaxID=2898658 RepID=UPI001F3FEF03|nr:hypothetical protein [Rubinisphaera sp. JC750]
MINEFWQDESGFVVSAELVLIATILILGLIVGLSSIQHAIVSELNDIGDAAGNANQSYWYTGFSKEKDDNNGFSAYTRGSAARDENDDCDNDQCEIACDDPVNEGPKL